MKSHREIMLTVTFGCVCSRQSFIGDSQIRRSLICAQGGVVWSEEAPWKVFMSGQKSKCLIIRFQLQMALQKLQKKKPEESADSTQCTSPDFCLSGWKSPRPLIITYFHVHSRGQLKSQMYRTTKCRFEFIKTFLMVNETDITDHTGSSGIAQDWNYYTGKLIIFSLNQHAKIN